jgi:nitrogen fixation protein NifU and related proteins
MQSAIIPGIVSEPASHSASGNLFADNYDDERHGFESAAKRGIIHWGNAYTRMIRMAVAPHRNRLLMRSGRQLNKSISGGHSMDRPFPNQPDDKPDDKPMERPAYSGPVLLYNEDVIDHFTNPRNVGELPASETDGYGLVGDPSCGDQMKLWIGIQSNRIEKIAFKSFGCPGAIATSSMLTDLAKGKTIEEARLITDDDVVDALGGIPERKKHCSLLGVLALQAAIRDWETRQSSERENNS